MQEIYNGCYAADPLGNVYSLKNHAGNRRISPYLLKPRLGRAGYYHVNLFIPTHNGKKNICTSIHRIMAETFLPNPNLKEEVNHINGNKLDNRVLNLEWVSKRENALHAFEHGLRTTTAPWKGKFNEKHNRSIPIKQLTLDGEMVQVFPSIQEARRQGFSQGNIYSVITGKRKTHKGFLWALA